MYVVCKSLKLQKRFNSPASVVDVFLCLFSKCLLLLGRGDCNPSLPPNSAQLTYNKQLDKGQLTSKNVYHKIAAKSLFYWCHANLVLTICMKQLLNSFNSDGHN